jgi:hypothetical protein
MISYIYATDQLMVTRTRVTRMRCQPKVEVCEIGQFQDVCSMNRGFASDSSIGAVSEGDGDDSPGCW